MEKETTSTNQGIGDEGYKGSDLSEIEKIDRRETSVKGAENSANQDLAVIIAGYKKEASDAVNVLNTFDSNLMHVFCASIEQLVHIEGIGFNPCEQDVLLTRELSICGLMGIEVLDYIIGIRDHVRFKERINVIRRWNGCDLMNRRLFLQVLLFLAIVGCTYQAYTISCTEIIDGDTFKLENGDTVRLIGIDAPELSQPGGEISREYLAHLILGKTITLEKGHEDKDKYNRLLRFVYIGNICVNEEMIRQGYAEARYLSENPIREYYIQLETEAETARAGLWNDNIFQPRSQVNWDTNLPVINWFDAEKYYGQYVIVEGIIVDTYSSGTVCFLNFHTDYQYFTAVIFASDFPAFPDPPDSYYLGKKVHIIGIIKEYKGSPEIIVKTPDQIKIIS